MSKLKVFFSFKLLHESFVSVVPVINLKPKKGWTVEQECLIVNRIIVNT